MNIFGLQIKKKTKSVAVSPISGTGFRDEDREMSLALRHQKAELKKLKYEAEKAELQAQLWEKKQELRMYRQQVMGDMYGDDMEDEEPEDENEKLFANVLASIIGGQQQPTQQKTTDKFTPQENTTTISMSDEAILEQIKHLPKAQVTMAKSMSDENLKAVLASYYDAQTIDRAITIFRQVYV